MSTSICTKYKNNYLYFVFASHLIGYVLAGWHSEGGPELSSLPGDCRTRVARAVVRAHVGPLVDLHPYPAVHRERPRERPGLYCEPHLVDRCVFRSVTQLGSKAYFSDNLIQIISDTLIVRGSTMLKKH